MCGIVGYTGNRQAAEILLDGLSKLEYRGYDVLGVAAVRYLSDSYGVAVDFLDFGPHLYAAAPLSAHILAAVSIAAGGEVGINLVLLALEYGYRRIDEFVKVVGENL